MLREADRHSRPAAPLLHRVASAFSSLKSGEDGATSDYFGSSDSTATAQPIAGIVTGSTSLRGRFNWTHDYNDGRAIGATFQMLPSASVVVNGAAQSPDKALATASAEVKWRSEVSLAATFEGEFSRNSSSYAGKGVARSSGDN